MNRISKRSVIVVIGALGAAIGLFYWFTSPEARFARVMASIANSSTITLYEGLPHQWSEQELLQAEVGAKKTISLHEFPFYAETFVPTNDDRTKLLALLGDVSRFEPFVDSKTCPPFHPDWLVEWKNGDGVHHALICFGCGEMKLRSRKVDWQVDIAKGSALKLADVLRGYRKNRPRRPWEPY